MDCVVNSKILFKCNNCLYRPYIEILNNKINYWYLYYYHKCDLQRYFIFSDRNLKYGSNRTILEIPNDLLISECNYQSTTTNLLEFSDFIELPNSIEKLNKIITDLLKLSTYK